MCDKVQPVHVDISQWDFLLMMIQVLEYLCISVIKPFPDAGKPAFSAYMVTVMMHGWKYGFLFNVACFAYASLSSN